MGEPKVCIDMADAPVEMEKRLALVRGKLWPKGTILRVAFLKGHGSEKLRSKVKDLAREWMKHANITLAFGAPLEDAHLRIAFGPDPGSWSYVGTDCKNVPLSKPTMN